MKKFLLLFLPVVIFSAVLMLAEASLFEVRGKKGYEAAYSASNLGFVLEERAATNFLCYKKDGIVVGECVFLAPQSDLNQICDQLGLTVLASYTIGNKTMIEGVSPRLKFRLEDRQANVQICATDDQLIIGSPIIYGSY